MIIHLHNLKFFAYHGLYKEEKVLGSEYELNIDVEVAQEGRVTMLDETVNYVSIYNRVKERMQQPEPLLETLAYDIGAAIRKMDDRIKKVTVSVLKLNPPVAGMQGSVGVSVCSPVGNT